MALYQPEVNGPPEVDIISADFVDKVTKYLIKVHVDGVTWTVSHRYSDFHLLHQQLVTNYGISKDALPPKKPIGYQNSKFIEKRKLQLEQYLKQTCNFLYRTFPVEVLIFLDFNKYEINTMLRLMAKDLFEVGDTLLINKEIPHMTVLELFAITVKLRLPLMVIHSGLGIEDFSHVLDYICQIEGLCITGSKLCHQASSIIPNNLKFELTMFKSLRNLTFNNVCLGNLSSLGNVKKTVEHLVITNSLCPDLSDIILCDMVHKNSSEMDASYNWRMLKTVSVIECELENIDDSTKFLPSLVSLNFKRNNISVIENLNDLPNLTILNLSFNKLCALCDLHLKLGNIKELDLSCNQITKLGGFQKLYSLTSLNLSSNFIDEIKEVGFLSKLPCLECLYLTGNPVSTIVDYRAKVLAMFCERACEVCLDSEVSSQKELDTVAVLQAIFIGQESITANKGSIFCLTNSGI